MLLPASRVAHEVLKVTTVLFTTLIILLNESSHITAIIQLQQRPATPQVDCPGSCTTIIGCKSLGGKIVGICMNGEMCCRDAGFNIPSGSCGSSMMANKVSAFRSPNYPVHSGGNMICEFTLYLSPATTGIRVDFLDLNLPSVPTNPRNFLESPNSICDSDFLLFRGFSGWTPDFRCGNLTGYSFMIERDNGQAALSTLLVMSSAKYRWNIKFTEIYYREIDAIDYSLRNTIYNKKQWIWSPTANGIMTHPFGIPGFPSTSLNPPWQFDRPFTKRDATEVNKEVEFTNGSSIIFETEGDTDSDTGPPLSRVVGGSDAKPNSIPWQVSLQLVTMMESDLCGQVRNLSSHFCGGSIVGERAILTASHCFFSSSRHSHPLLPYTDIKVVVGEHNLCSDSEVKSTRAYNVERIIFHFNYLASDVINDVAVIHVTKPILFDQNVHPIVMADERTKVEVLKPQIGGWGSLGVDENSTYPAILQESRSMVIISEEDCRAYQREFLEYVVPDDKLSGKYKSAFDHGICTEPTENAGEAGFGDSGGPLVGLHSNGGPVLLGIVSHMRPHVNKKTEKEFHLNYFAKVAAYRKWILMTMAG